MASQFHIFCFFLSIILYLKILITLIFVALALAIASLFIKILDLFNLEKGK